MTLFQAHPNLARSRVRHISLLTWGRTLANTGLASLGHKNMAISTQSADAYYRKNKAGTSKQSPPTFFSEGVVEVALAVEEAAGFLVVGPRGAVGGNAQIRRYSQSTTLLTSWECNPDKKIPTTHCSTKSDTRSRRRTRLTMDYDGARAPTASDNRTYSLKQASRRPPLTLIMILRKTAHTKKRGHGT